MSNVRHFGAVGDGQADDTAAIHHALNEGDGLLEFPRGQYRITRPIEIELASAGRTSIRGLSGTAKIVMAGPGPAFLLKGTHTGTADPAGFRPEQWRQERMPMVQEIEIEGAHAEADGLRIDGVMQPTLSGVLVREVRHAVHVVHRARNLLVTHCHFYHNTGTGIFLDRVNLHQVIIADSHISYCRLGGIRIEASEIRNLQITGNDIEYNNHRSHKDLPDEPTADIYIDVGESGTVREGTIVSNTIQSTYSQEGANLRMIGGAAGQNHRAGMWTISGNLIGSQKTNVHLTAIRGVVLSGNYIYSGHHRNLLVEDSRNVVVGPNCLGHNPDYRKNELATGIRFENCQNGNLTGLLIEDAEAGRHTVPGAVPISRLGLVELVGCRRFNLSGLQILDPTPHGLYLKDCTDTLVTGCTIQDDRHPRRMVGAIRWEGSTDGSQVSHCRIGRGLEGDWQAPEGLARSGNLHDD